jgi:hypothetical protein
MAAGNAGLAGPAGSGALNLWGAGPDYIEPTTTRIPIPTYSFPEAGKVSARTGALELRS